MKIEKYIIILIGSELQKPRRLSIHGEITNAERPLFRKFPSLTRPRISVCSGWLRTPMSIYVSIQRNRICFGFHLERWGIIMWNWKYKQTPGYIYQRQLDLYVSASHTGMVKEQAYRYLFCGYRLIFNFRHKRPPPLCIYVLSIWLSTTHTILGTVHRTPMPMSQNDMMVVNFRPCVKYTHIMLCFGMLIV